MEDKNKGKIYIKIFFIYLLYIIIIPIIVYDLFLIIQTNINPNITPSFFGYKTFSIVSGSMEPKIKIDDVIIVKNINKSEIHINDIITFRINNDIVTHRIIDIEEVNEKTTYTTKGDKNTVSDIEKIEFEQVEGKYITRIPKIGKILTLLKNKIVFLIILTILIICFCWERRIYNLKIKRKEKREEYEKKKRLQ